VYVDWLRDKSGATGKSDAWWDSQADGKPGPREHAEDRQLAQRLYRLVDELAEEDKQLIYLHFYQGLSLRETAGVLDEAASTVRYRFSRAIRKLRSEIGGR
jgi:RNA polymerase sigma factor (sigma-70 family)